jgi:hypothetical protein
MCLARAKLWESLIPFVALFDEYEVERPRRRACKVKYDYDWRVVVAKERRE